MNLAIETLGLTKRFPAGGGLRGILAPQKLTSPAVDRVDLQVEAGELFGLLGPNGAGKTTLIKMLSTLVTPTGGTARVNGYDLRNEEQIKASIGLATSDERSFYWRLTGRQNLDFFASLHGLKGNQAEKQVEKALSQAGVLEVAGRQFQTYSTGMRQRLSIARALLNEPHLLFLDEPSKGLDPTATRHFHELIRKLCDEAGLTVFLTTHRLEEAQSICDRVAIMNHGRIRACGTLLELGEHLQLERRYRVQVGYFPAGLETQLEQCVPNVEIHFPHEQEAEPGASISFPSDQGNGVVNDVLDLLRVNQVTLKDITHEPISLETIFSDLVEAEPQNKPSLNQEFAPLTAKPVLPDLRPPNILRQLPPLPIVLAFLKRDYRMEASYRLSFFLQFFSIFFSVVMFYFVAQLLGDTVNPYLAPYGGDYFSFVLIGIAFSSYFSVSLSSFSSSLRQAQTTGTLEAMLASPTSVSTIILSSSMWDYLVATLRVLAYLAVGATFLGVDIGRSNWPAALLILLLTVITFSSMGILAASFIMVLKRGDPVTWIFTSLSSLLGGVYYPITVLPEWLQMLSRLLPITYALQAMRLAVLQGATFGELLPNILALGLFSILLLPLSLIAFRYAVRRARLDGSLTHY